MSDTYDKAISRVVAALEDLPRIKAPAADYLAALERAERIIGVWLDASIAAAEDDVKREEGDH